MAGAVLLAVYLGLSLLCDPRAYLGTDTGGKVATLRVMEERGRLDPDIGYWAEEWDPAGRLHPLYFTQRIGDRWVNATTLPVLYAASPLYRLGGYRLALLLPALGSVLSALAARALARRLAVAPGSDGWGAYWIVGLASPLTIYALDIWEHSLGVAAMAWAVVLLLDGVEALAPTADRGPAPAPTPAPALAPTPARRRLGWAAFAGAGALFGAAAAMRTEALVYGFVAVGAACLVLAVGRRRLAGSVVGGVAALAGFAVPVALNAALEVATVGQAIRFRRAGGAAAGAVSAGGSAGAGDGFPSRVQEALLNAAGLNPVTETLSYAVGVMLLALLVFVCLRATRGGDTGPAVLAAGGVAVLYLIRFADGPGFVPGLVAATPLAVVGLVLGWGTAAARYVLGVGLAALPLVWATQFKGGAAPQWAGRYLLVSGLLFGVAGIVVLRRLPRWAARGAVGLAVVVTAFGVLWTSIRTHDFASALAALNRRDEPVLISRIGHLAREGGAFYGDRRWLTAPSADDQAFAVDVLERAGVDRFALVEVAEGRVEQTFAGWRRTGRDRVRLVDEVDLAVTTFRRVGP